jgi:signal transduction histidine kinase/CheY-like chemotaxis protein
MIAQSSLRWKVTGLIATVGVMAALIAAVGFSWRDLDRFWERTGVEIGAIGSIVAEQAAPAVMLGDRAGAMEILGSLRTDTRIHAAAIYDDEDACFATFRRDAGSECPALPKDGTRTDGNSLMLVRAVQVGDERVGTLLLAAEVPSITAILRQYLGGAAMVVLLSLLVAAVLAISLESRISAPILAIAQVARRMAETHRFDQRVRVVSSDEVGVLATSFNMMLNELERRDLELARQREQLELEVAERSRVNAELRQAKEKAESAARLKSEFLANMSHEIRTPLNGVTGMISLVLDSCRDEEQVQQLRVAKSAADSLTAILNDILDLSKIEVGKMTIESIDFNLHDTVRECLQIFDLTARKKELRLTASLGPDCPVWVQGDPVRLRQILVNLLGNAVKFTLGGGVDVAVTGRESGVVQFTVSDTGIGIPEEKLESIFDPFTQADGSHTRRFGGTGLGLTITQRLVKLMGGHLWAESEPGKGSSFHVELPMEEQPEPSQTNQGTEVALPDLPPLHVLVAEDNAINQKVACGLLAKQGWIVEMAETGEQAYRKFFEQSFDLILMDIQMPDVDGFEATSLIRREERRRGLRRTPIIAFTAHASEGQHEQCIANGMDGVVTKPLNIAALLQTVAGVIASAAAPGPRNCADTRSVSSAEDADPAVSPPAA